MKHVNLALLAALLMGCGRSDAGEAQRAAEAFARDIEGATGKVACTQADTDQNGYCGCTVFRHAPMPPLAIDCGCEAWCWLNCARGCKLIETVNVRTR